MTGSLYFNTDDVDALWDRLKDRCEVVYPIDDFEYGMREFAVRDNSGYLLQFGKQIRLVTIPTSLPLLNLCFLVPHNRQYGCRFTRVSITPDHPDQGTKVQEYSSWFAFGGDPR